MILLNGSRIGALILTVYISLNPWLAASAPTDPAQAPSIANALISPSIGSENVSVYSPTALSLIYTSSLALGPISDIATASPSSPSGPSIIATTMSTNSTAINFINATTTAASSTKTPSPPFNINTTAAQTVPDGGGLIAVSSPNPSSALSSIESLLTTSASSVSHDVSSSATESSVESSPTTSASSTSHVLSSSATESSIATFVPRAPPSNAHVAKLAEIIVPSVVGGAGIGTGLWRLFGKLAKSQKAAGSVARALRMAQKTELLDSLSIKQQAWIRHIVRMALLEEGRNPGTLTRDQARRVRLVEQGGESIWNGNDIPSLPEPCIGSPFCVDWPGSPPGSAPPSEPDPSSDTNPPSGPDTPFNTPKSPSDPNIPIDPNLPAGPDPPSNGDPPATPNSPSDPNSPSEPNTPAAPDSPSEQSPPLTPYLPSDPSSPSEPNTPAEPDLPPPATEESIRLANELPMLPEASWHGGRFAHLPFQTRLVPPAYRTLPLDAKIVYATKYSEDVWSQRLRYISDTTTAAVDSNNKPLKDWNFDRAGDLIDYQGMTLREIKKGNFPDFSQTKLQEDYHHMKGEIGILQNMEEVERARVANTDPPATPQGPPPEPPQPTPTPPPPEPTPAPPEPAPTPPPPEPPPAPAPAPAAPAPAPAPSPPDLSDQEHDQKYIHDHRHHAKHKHHKKMKGAKCILFWNWGKCAGRGLAAMI